MKTLFEHIEYAKSKPHHIRKRIAFTAAAIGAALVALLWFFSTLSSGVFALRDNTFADSAGAEFAGTADAAPGNSADAKSGIAGAAAAPLQAADTPAYIEIIDSSSSVSGEKRVEPTILPF